MAASVKNIEEHIARLEQKRIESEKALRNAKKRLQEQIRRNRYHHLHQVGQLVVNAGIDDSLDQEILLGAFRHLAKLLSDEPTRENYRKLGTA